MNQPEVLHDQLLFKREGGTSQEDIFVMRFVMNGEYGKIYGEANGFIT